MGSGYGWFPLDLSLTYDQIARVAHDVLGWLEQQPGFSSVGVLGFSQGSTVATHCMRLAPERFAYGVVLSGFVVPVAPYTRAMPYRRKAVENAPSRKYLSASSADRSLRRFRPARA